MIRKKYDLIFEPNDPVLYAAKDTFITLNVIPVYSMNVTAGNFGTVILEGRTANDKYARGSVLKATAVADKNYRFAGWSDGNTSATRELQANANLDIVARFDPVLYGVTFTDPMNGSLKVFANGVEVKNGAEFLQGTLLTITATPDAGYMVQSVKVNGALVNNGSYTLTQAADISADFLQKSLWHLQNIKNERALHKIQKVGNDMATVLISAFCSALHSNNSSAAKVMRICE